MNSRKCKTYQSKPYKLVFTSDRTNTCLEISEINLLPAVLWSLPLQVSHTGQCTVAYHGTSLQLSEMHVRIQSSDRTVFSVGQSQPDGLHSPIYR